MKPLTYSSFTFLIIFFCSTLFAQNFTSTNQPTQLIELYTSEGCSSCPPADRWLNKLKHNPKLWSDFIPVAFHVDYWDYIGWNDPFAHSEYSDRQRQYAREKNISSVYTPGMLLNGREWTSWRKQSHLKLPVKTTTTGKLSITFDNGSVTATYQAADIQQVDLILNIAILGFDIKSEVNAGENTGYTFIHDFVVLGFKRIAMQRTEPGVYSASLDQLPQLTTQSNTLAISTWINSKRSLTPLQATGGWLE